MSTSDDFQQLGEITESIIQKVIEMRTCPLIDGAQRCERMMQESENPLWVRRWVEYTTKADEAVLEARRAVA